MAANGETGSMSDILADQADRLFGQHATRAVLAAADDGTWPEALWQAVEEAGLPLAAVAEALHRRDAADSTVVDFLTAADGVTVVDSTPLDFAQTVAAVLDVVAAGNIH